MTQIFLRRVIRQAFEIWSAVIPRNFVEVSPNDPNARILIKFEKRNHGFDGTGRVLAHALPGDYVHFDDDETWKIYRPYEKVYFGQVDLLSVAIHEIGHSLGLRHSDVINSIMQESYKNPADENGNYVFPRLLTSVIADIQSIYGPRIKSSGNGMLVFCSI
uniref:Peptidase metallopeptidase domain-containing protein n=1 Tax=Panagrolaimus sp. ES5 TaxID=591445 RepID=A0AC34F0R2_9BILA